jgi:hypothetical protein
MVFFLILIYSLSIASAFTYFPVLRRSFRPLQQTNFDELPPRPSSKHSLAIVPPDEAWDAIQRARHIASDSTYHIWPPAIRLLHPFDAGAGNNNLALAVASVIERHNLTSFEIRLDRWSIIPHAQAMMETEQRRKAATPQRQAYVQSTPWQEKEDERVRKLIAQEEQIGRENKRRRLERQQRQRRRNKVDTNTNTNSNAQDNTKEEDGEEKPDAPEEEPKEEYDEYNGPCVVVLEPDEESAELLIELRELLLEDPRLQHFQAYSPTLSVTDSNSFAAEKCLMTEYRPVVPIAAFSSVTAAIPVAQNLKQSWEPLDFPVTDLQMLCLDEKEKQYGCDAMIMFTGEELEMDQELNQEMTDMLVSKGEKGGFARNEPNKHDDNDTENLDVNDGDMIALQQWLEEEDDDYDAGSVVVIGRYVDCCLLLVCLYKPTYLGNAHIIFSSSQNNRTHFFTGENRFFVEMPASSIREGKGDQSKRRGRKKLEDVDFGLVQ